MGIDLLRKFGVIMDLPHKALCKAKEGEAGNVIPAAHRVAATKAPKALSLPKWEEEVTQVAGKHLKAFATSKLSCEKIKALVKINGPDPKPVRQYKFLAEAQIGIKPTIEALMQQGVLITCDSPCNPPIWPVRKSDGKSWHLTVDYHALNKVTPRMGPVVAKFPEIMALITARVCWYSVLDLENAFFSIPLDQSCQHKFAFTYDNRQITFTRVSQGLHNAPSICHQHVAAMWKNLRYSDCVISYVDDVLIATKSKEDNLKALDEVLEAIQTTGFLINPEKAQLLKQEVSYLGVQLGPTGRRPDQAQVELISNLPSPSDISTLQSFLGLVGFLRDFIKGFSEKAKPIYNLLRKNQEWQWGAEEKEVTMLLKKALMEAPALAFPDPSKPFHLQIASTKSAISAVLLQQQGTSVKPVAYGSLILTPIESQFTACEREVLSLVWAMAHWEYIIGMSPILLRTIHTPVRYVLSSRANSGRVNHPRLANWTLALINMDITVEKTNTPGKIPFSLCVTVPDDNSITDHECPILPTTPSEIQSPFTLEEKFEDAKTQKRDLWVVDGSSLYVDGKAATGFTAMQVASGKVFQGTIKQRSTQATELVAIISTLENVDPSVNITICTDSDWVTTAFVDWMPVWKTRDKRASDDHPVAYAGYLHYAWQLAEQRSGDTYLFKV
ncbi:unnamed protein product [Caretta caretta]